MPVAARGSIGTPAMRGIQVSNFTMWAALAKAASVAALSPTSASIEMFEVASPRASGAPGATAATECVTAGTGS